MVKKQATIELLMFGMAIGESMTQLSNSQQDQLLQDPIQFTDELSWGITNKPFFNNNCQFVTWLSIN